MKRTLLGFIFLFLLAASFTAGFYSVALAIDSPCGYHETPVDAACCWDELDRSGVWYRNPVPYWHWECRCSDYPGWPTLNGPCNCQLDCIGQGGGQG
ncbi:MAG: hypothetical protein GYA46_04295 [candidate division Zixibacteria bacterium]|nr:hypothetical protein [candidate division Zixibacteria bacterium]